MSNDAIIKPADPTDANKKTKLPQLDGNTVEEVPASDLDEVAGGFTDCHGTGCQGTSSVVAARV